MVKKLLLLTLFCFVPLHGFFNLGFEDSPLIDGVSLKVEIDDHLALEGKKISGRLIVFHPEKQSVNESSFKIGEEPLSVQLVSQGRQSSISMVCNSTSGKSQTIEINQKISHYHFELDPKDKGLHKLPKISVVVGGQTYETESLNYFVASSEESSKFALETYVDAPKIVYPGESMSVKYRLSMVEPIEIFYEHLPLLDLKEFQKMGKCERKIFYKGQCRIEEFSQAYVAEKPGEYELPDSFLEGRAFFEDQFGRRSYKKEMLKAQAPKLKLKIEAFPKDNQPDSFNGAVGKFEIACALDSSNQVCVGDKLKLKVTFKGQKNLNSVKMPDLSKQNAFKENFRFNDMPLLADKNAAEKVYLYELRPMREDITEIPSFKFSYFDTESTSYKTLKTQSIPITLLPTKKVEIQTQPVVSLAEQEIDNALKSPEVTLDMSPDLIDIQNIYPIQSKDVRLKKEIKIWPILTLVFLSILVQLIWKNSKKKRSNFNTSLSYLQRALSYRGAVEKHQVLIEKALLMRLKEKNHIKELCSVDDLSSEGVVGEVREFIDQLNAELFSGQKTFDLKVSLEKAEFLFKKIGDGN